MQTIVIKAYLVKTLFLTILVFLATDSFVNAGQPVTPLQTIRQKHHIQGELADLEKMIDPSESAWIEAEKELYQGVLKGRTYDVLLVPFQNMARPIALTSRKLITYRLASEMRHRIAVTVAPIHLVYRALGNTARHFEDEDIYRLASQLGVKHIIWGFIGNRGNNSNSRTKYNISLIRQEFAPAQTEGQTISKSWEGMPAKASNLPAAAFSSIMDEVIGFIGLGEKRTDGKSRKTETDPDGLQLPEGPLQMVRCSDSSPIVQASYMQLLGLLTPTHCGLEIQKDFFIRSLALLWQADDSSEYTRLLLARAYLYLDQRPTAVKLLGSPTTPEANAFNEFLNANLTDQDTNIQQIRSPLKRLMAQLEQYHLKAMYTTAKKKPDIRYLIDGLDETWQYVIAQKLLDHDNWSLQSNVTLKAFLDEELPVDGLTMEAHYKAAAASDELEQKQLEFEMLFVDHIFKAIRSGTTRLLPLNRPDGLSDYDSLLLFRAIGETNLLKFTRFYQKVQGKPDTALQLIDAFLTVFQGHPAFHIRKTDILESINKHSKSLTAMRKSDLMKKIMQNGFDGLWWIGQQDPVLETNQIAGLLRYTGYQLDKEKIQLGKQENPGAKIETYLQHEFPPSTTSLLGYKGFTIREKLEFIHCNIYDYYKLAIKMLEDSPPSARMLVDNRERFQGNPEWPSMRARFYKGTGKYNALENIYKEGIYRNPLFWDNYEGLGLEYLRNGEYQKAETLFMKYPPFTQEDTEYHRVALSNDSFKAGNHFFRRGDCSAARSFYGISAGLETGSGASLLAQVRLSLMDQDFDMAAAYSKQVARRYNDEDGYRDYMSLLHLLGQSELAWPMFDSLVGRFRSPEIWNSALIGHRVNATSKKEFKKWINNTNKLVQGSTTNPAIFFIRSLIDRKPDISDADLIGELGLRQIPLSPYREHLDLLLTGKKTLYDHTPLVDDKEMVALMQTDPPKTYLYIAQGYIYLRQKSYQKSFDALKKISSVRSLLEPGGRQLLPYLVLSAFKSGKVTLAEQLIKQEFLEARDFDTALAKAVLMGMQKDHTNSLALFNKAFNNQPTVKDRLFFSWYQIVELLEWLYIDTGEAGYLDQAMIWAKAHQAVQPMFAWAYAFEAKYSEDRKERLHALAYANYLDRDSAWISHFSNKDKVEAKAWFEKHNPFTVIEQLEPEVQQSI